MDLRRGCGHRAAGDGGGVDMIKYIVLVWNSKNKQYE